MAPVTWAKSAGGHGETGRSSAPPARTGNANHQMPAEVLLRKPMQHPIVRQVDTGASGVDARRHAGLRRLVVEGRNRRR